MAFPADACHNLQTADVAVAAAVAVAVAVAAAAVVASASACCLQIVAAALACSMASAVRSFRTGAVVAAAASPSSCWVGRAAVCQFGLLGWGSWFAPCSWDCRSYGSGAWHYFDAHLIAYRNCSCSGLIRRHGSNNSSRHHR